MMNKRNMEIKLEKNSKNQINKENKNLNNYKIITNLNYNFSNKQKN